jgi:hypothetical protein
MQKNKTTKTKKRANVVVKGEAIAREKRAVENTTTSAPIRVKHKNGDELLLLHRTKVENKGSASGSANRSRTLPFLVKRKAGTWASVKDICKNFLKKMGI